MTFRDKVSSTLDNRQDDYGNPENNFQAIADRWTMFFWQKYPHLRGTFHISREDVAIMMIDMKIAREVTAHKEDNLIDIVGYAEHLHTMRYKKNEQ